MKSQVPLYFIHKVKFHKDKANIPNCHNNLENNWITPLLDHLHRRRKKRNSMTDAQIILSPSMVTTGSHVTSHANISQSNASLVQASMRGHSALYPYGSSKSATDYAHNYSREQTYEEFDSHHANHNHHNHQQRWVIEWLAIENWLNRLQLPITFGNWHYSGSE